MQLAFYSYAKVRKIFEKPACFSEKILTFIERNYKMKSSLLGRELYLRVWSPSYIKNSQFYHFRASREERIAGVSDFHATGFYAVIDIIFSVKFILFKKNS